MKIEYFIGLLILFFIIFALGYLAGDFNGRKEIEKIKRKEKGKMIKNHNTEMSDIWALYFDLERNYEKEVKKRKAAEKNYQRLQDVIFRWNGSVDKYAKR